MKVPTHDIYAGTTYTFCEKGHLNERVFNWTRNYFGDYSTRFSLFAQASSGKRQIGRFGFYTISRFSDV